MEEKLRALGASLRRLRAGRSQGKIAKAVGISTQQYSNIECGNNWPSMPVYMKLCRLHGVKVPLV